MFFQFFDGSNINLVIAMMAGFITFFASCLLPLVPTYLAYLSGVTLNSEEAENKRWQIVKVATLFVIGFITTFVLLGLGLNQFAVLIARYKNLVNQLAGLLFILMGLFMWGVFKHRLFSQERKLDFQGFFTKNKSLHAVMTGIAFGLGWTPCIGPILAVILFWSAQAETTFKGVSLLISYGVGLGIPFILVALAFEKIIPLLRKYSKISKYTNYLAGGIIILAGILMFSGKFQELSLILLQVFKLDTLSV